MQEIQQGVYIIRNKVDNKIYVGRTLNFRKRIIAHRNELDNQIHHSFRLQRAWNKHKEENFEFIFIEECTKENYRDREQFWIDALNPDYNLLTNSRGGRYGKHTEKTIELMRQKRQEKSGKKIYQFELDGTFIKEWNCISDVMRAFNKNSTAHFITCCQGKRSHAYGYKWSYNLELSQEFFVKARCHPVLQFDLEGNFVREFESMTEISKVLNVKKHTVIRYISGKLKQTKTILKNYIWQLKES